MWIKKRQKVQKQIPKSKGFIFLLFFCSLRFSCNIWFRNHLSILCWLLVKSTVWQLISFRDWCWHKLLILKCSSCCGSDSCTKIYIYEKKMEELLFISSLFPFDSFQFIFLCLLLFFLWFSFLLCFVSPTASSPSQLPANSFSQVKKDTTTFNCLLNH